MNNISKLNSKLKKRPLSFIGKIKQYSDRNLPNNFSPKILELKSPFIKINNDEILKENLTDRKLNNKLINLSSKILSNEKNSLKASQSFRKIETPKKLKYNNFIEKKFENNENLGLSEYIVINNESIAQKGDIFSQEEFYFYQEAYNKAKDFINNNINGVLINAEKIKLSQKPNVSVVIPCCDCKKYILRAIRSIQNQDFSNYEIIIVNDGSKDGSLEYIQQLQKEEERIRIISNNVNKGTLYTRSIGTLSANGKY